MGSLFKEWQKNQAAKRKRTAKKAAKKAAAKKAARTRKRNAKKATKKTTRKKTGAKKTAKKKSPKRSSSNGFKRVRAKNGRMMYFKKKGNRWVLTKKPKPSSRR